MSATVAAALKKIAVALLTDRKVLKTIGGILLGILVILLLPLVVLVSFFSGGAQVDTDRLYELVEQGLSAEEQQRLQSVEDTMLGIETAMSDAGFSDRTKEAQVLYVLGLSDRVEEDEFLDRLVDCFASDQTDLALIEKVNDTFGTTLSDVDFTNGMRGIREKEKEKSD